MIGGKDIVIPISTGSAAITIVLREISIVWPHAVVEDAETGELMKAAGRKELMDCGELLIYKDEFSADQWDKLGEDESLDGTMLQVIIGKNQITIVVDSTPSEQIDSLVSSIRHAIRQGTPRQGAKLSS